MKITKIVVAFIMLLVNTYACALPAEDVEIINDRDYFPRVHEILKNAKKTSM